MLSKAKILFFNFSFKEYPILELVMDWFVQKTADSMSGKDLNNMAEEYQKQQMPAHYRYLVE